MDPVLYAVCICGGAAALLLLGSWIANRLGW